MILDTPIELGAILAFVGGVVSKLVYDEISRWRHRRIAERETKIEWYNDLAALATEIQIMTLTRARNFEYLSEDANLAEQSLSEFFTEEEWNDLQSKAKERGGEIPEELADYLAFEEWTNKKGEVQERLSADMNVYQERLTQHLANRPMDIEEDTFETALSLLSALSAAGMVGRVNEGYVEMVNEIVGKIDTQCVIEIERLKPDRFLRSG